MENSEVFKANNLNLQFNNETTTWGNEEMAIFVKTFKKTAPTLTHSPWQSTFIL